MNRQSNPSDFELESLIWRFLRVKEFGHLVADLQITRMTSKSGLEAIFDRGRENKNFSVEVSLQLENGSLPSNFSHEIDGNKFNFFFQKARPVATLSRTAKIL